MGLVTDVLDELAVTRQTVETVSSAACRFERQVMTLPTNVRVE